MNADKKFKIHGNDYCHILTDKIVLTQTNKLDNPSGLCDIDWGILFVYYC
ncbi:MAG: hypothetical protein ACI85O_001974 [Saprospiraceae bacterium]|jgi:hypothetical protein